MATTKTWRERVVAAQKRGKFTAKDKVLVNDWSTCAVGEQRKAHPTVSFVRVGFGYGLDETLYELGCASRGGFAWAVQRDEVAQASDLLDQIEDRVLQLKRGEGHDTPDA